MTDSTINDEEVAKFAAMAEEWWDPRGKFRPLHKFNPARLGYVRDKVLSHFGRDGNARRPFEGLRLLDIGCGGGLLSEPMARLGATVVGADAAERNIAIARLHAEQSGLEIDYRATTAEALAAAGERFDVVLNMEVVEHVDNVALYMQSCAELVAPGGLLFTASINRTPRAWALAIVGAERVLRWLPKGAHDYRKFLTPEEIGALVERHGLRVIDRTGVVFHPLADAWRLSRDMGVNYMVLAEKPAADSRVAANAADESTGARFSETAIITLLVDENPKRGASAKRFSLYRSGMTVRDYLDACLVIQPEWPRSRWRADLAWDTERGFISID